MSGNGIDFVYAQTNDAFGEIETYNAKTGEKEIIRKKVAYGQGDKILPFPFMGWVECTANTASDWISGCLNNVHTYQQKEQEIADVILNLVQSWT